MKTGSQRMGADADAAGHLDALPLGVVAADRQGRISFLNRCAAELLEVDPDRAAGGLAGELFEGASRGILPRRTQSGDIRLIEITARETANHRLFVLQDVTERVRAEQHREHESDVALRLALAAGRMGTWRWNEATNAVRWSESLEAIFGLAPGTFPGTFEAFLSYVHPEDRLFVMERVGQAGESGPEYEIEFRIVRPDGAQRWIADRGQVLFDENGRRCGIAGVCWDSTEERLRRLEREQLTAQLRAAHALLDTLFDHAPVGLGFWDRELRFVKVNRALAEMSGTAPETHIGKQLPELLPRMDEGVHGALRHVLETGEAVLKMEAHGYTPARPGVLRHWSVSCYPIRLAGEIAGVGAVCEDITQRKETDRKLAAVLASEIRARGEAQEAEERAGFLAEAATVLSSSLDFRAALASVARLAVPRMADWCAVDILENGQRQRLAVAHVNPEKVRLAQELHVRFPPKEDDPVLQVLRTGEPAMAAEIPDELLERLATDAEHLRIVRELGLRSYVVVPVKYEGETLGAVTFVSAESGVVYGDPHLRLAMQIASRAGLAVQHARLYAQAERRRVEAERAIQELQRANADLEEFAYVASHDLQEPLRTIASYTQLLQREYEGKLDAAADEHIQKVVNGVTRMRDLIRDLLDYSRVSRSEEAPEGRVSMPVVLERCKETLQAAIEESGAEIVSDPLPEVAPADEAQMEQLMLNLLSNAIKYRRRDTTPRIEIAVAPAGGHWLFEVRDNGQGFKPELEHRLFGIFKRLHGKEVPGTGIGLALCRRIVERHSGTITAHGIPGQGATFRFTLPRLQ